MKSIGLLQKKEKNSENVSKKQVKSSEPPKIKYETGKGYKEKALIFHTDRTAEEKDIEIYDGKALVKYNEPIGDKEFVIDQCEPILVRQKGFLGSANKLLYLLKWDKLRPCQLQLKNDLANSSDYAEMSIEPNGNEVRETLVPFNPSFGTQTGHFKDVTPELLRQTYDLRFLKHLKTYAGDDKKGFSLGRGKGIFMLILFALIFGVVFIYSYSYLGGFG